MEPEILVVDEVLAVGDAEFQKKAIGKMQEISRGGGRTVLFVSHNMASIQNLCTRVMLLYNGTIDKIGTTDEVINYYLKGFRNKDIKKDLSERKDRKGSGKLKFLKFWFENHENQEIGILQSGMTAKMVLKILNTSSEELSNIRISVGIDDSNASRITLFSNDLTNQPITFSSNEESIVKIKIPSVPFQAGSFHFTLFCSIQEVISDWILNAGTFDVEHGDFFKSGRIVEVNQGNFLVPHEFNK